MKTGLESLDTGAPNITYSSNEGPKSPKKIQRAMADPLLEEEYEKYVFEMEEQGLQPMSFEEFERQARSGMNEGGVAQLVKNNADGSRPGYRGEAAAASAAASDRGMQGRSVGSDPQGRGDGRATNDRGVYGTRDPMVQFGTTPEEKAVVEAIAKRELAKREVPIGFGDKINFPNIFPTTKAALNFFKVPTGNVAARTMIKNLKSLEDPEELDSSSDRGGYFSPIILPIPTTTGLDTTDADADATTTTSTFTPTTDFNEYDVDQANRDVMVSLGVDPRMFAADGGRIGYAGGGITDLRQGYFLGKLVKKATRAVKKIVKSPIGKAAILAGGAGLLGGIGPFAGLRTSGLGKFLMGGKLPAGMMGPVRPGFFGKALNYAKTNPFKTIGLASLLPFVMPQEKEALDDSTARADEFNPFDQYGGVAGLRRRALAGNLDPAEFAFMRPEFYAAGGGLAENRMAALNELYGVNNEEEQKLSQGGSAGLPPITMASEGVDTQSFGDDESTGMAQATPTMPNQMPMRQPMMNPMMGRMNPMMARGMMNPMMGRGMMNPMMGRGMPMMGGRMMANEGGMMASAPSLEDSRNEMMENLAMEYYGRPLKLLNEQEIIEIEEMMFEMDPYGSKPMARPDRVMAQEGGLMDMGGMEKDYRNEGGFVPIGGQERADDVPARLSKNEFVFTADAVRNAGGGDIDKGAEIMENMMENLEAGGKVSEESQGLRGAREMFATQQRLGEVL